MRKRAKSKKEEMIDKFYKFLLDHDAFHEWIANIKKYSKLNRKWFFYHIESISYISSAFIWSETAEDIAFWNSLNIQWKKTVK